MNVVRRILAILSLWLPAATIWFTWIVWRDRLPEELPTHWGASGPADAVTDGTTLFGWLFGVAVAIAAVGSALLLVPMRGRWTQRAAGGLLAAGAAMTLGMWLMSTATALDATDPYTVHLGAWTLTGMIAPAYGLLTLALLPLGTKPPVRVQRTEPVAAMQLQPSESVAWSHATTSGLFIGTAVLVVGVTALMIIPPVLDGEFASLRWTLVPMLAATLLVVLVCAFRVTVDWRGLRVTSFLLGIPLKRISASEIATVEITELEPTAWGGWGYRIMPGRSALILGKGPGLVVTLRNEKQFAVSLPRPEEPASILLNLIDSPTARQL